MESSALSDWTRDLGIEAPPRQSEIRLWMRDPSTLALVASAQLDVHFVAEPHALVIDFKSGFKGATDADKNWQLLTQGVCLKHEYPKLQSFHVAIASARLKSSFDMAVYTREGIDEGEKEIRHAIWLSKQPSPRRVPGAWCQYCRSNGQCAEAAAYSSIVLFDQKLRDWSKLAIVESVSKMEPQQLAHVFTHSKIAQIIFDSVEARLKNMTPEQLDAVGLAFKSGATNRKVTDYAQARLLISNQLSKEEIDSCSSLSLAKVEDVLRTKFTLKKDAAKARAEGTLESVIVKTQNQPSLTAK